MTSDEFLLKLGFSEESDRAWGVSDGWDESGHADREDALVGVLRDGLICRLLMDTTGVAKPTRWLAGELFLVDKVVVLERVGYRMVNSRLDACNGGAMSKWK